MLIKKLPIVISPPKLSIFWSTPWPYERSINFRRRRSRETDITYGEARKEYRQHLEEVFQECSGGMEPNISEARKIQYKGENIRVWPHEFSEMTNQKMKMYILEEQSHILIKDTLIDFKSEQTSDLKYVEDEISKPLYEAALLDGCNENEAQAVAMGIDLTIEDIEFPPIGWYKIKPEIGLCFCSEEELEETVGNGMEVCDTEL